MEQEEIHMRENEEEEEGMESMLCNTFCSKCQEIFTGDIKRLDHYRWSPHHQSLSAFKRAVHENCYICSRSWTKAALKNPDFFKTEPEATPPRFFIKYQFSFDLDGKWGSHKGPHNTIGIVLGCYRQDDAGPAIELCTKFDAFSSKDFPRAATRPRSLSSSQTLETAKIWLHTCLDSMAEEHENCSRLQTAGFTPTRLIQVADTSSELWVLRVPEEEALEVQSYMTLSYRWGSSPFIKLTSSNFQDLRHGSSISTLPKTFQDAIQVTRSLGIKFLWIDALCILQDDEHDWRKESSVMYNVYQNSVCNIAAAASHSPTEGLFRLSSSNEWKLGNIKPTWSNLVDPVFSLLQHVDTVMEYEYLEKELDQSPLASRAWIFQERLSAPRTLHFFEGQICWTCHAGVRCEALPYGLIHSPEWDRIDFENERNYLISWTHSWETMIKFYSSCKVTVPSDKLIALSSIANKYMEETGDTYLAGLWRNGLDRLVNWRVNDLAVLYPRATPYRAPTWSWASIDSGVNHFDPLHHNGPHSMITVVGAEVATIGDDTTGHVSGGILVLKGVALTMHYAGSISDTNNTKWSCEDNSYVANVRFDICDPEGSLTSTPLEFLTTYVLSGSLEFDRDKRQHGFPWHSHHRAPFKVCGLVLNKCATPSSQYERIGYFEMIFGLAEGDVVFPSRFGKAHAEFEKATKGFDGRLDAPNMYSLAETLGFKFEAGREDMMRWEEDEALMRTFEIV